MSFSCIRVRYSQILVPRQRIFCGIMLPTSCGTPTGPVRVLPWHSFPPYLITQPEPQILIGLFSDLGVAHKFAGPLLNEDVLEVPIRREKMRR